MQVDDWGPRLLAAKALGGFPLWDVGAVVGLQGARVPTMGGGSGMVVFYPPFWYVMMVVIQRVKYDVFATAGFY